MSATDTGIVPEHFIHEVEFAHLIRWSEDHELVYVWRGGEAIVVLSAITGHRIEVVGILPTHSRIQVNAIIDDLILEEFNKEGEPDLS